MTNRSMAAAAGLAVLAATATTAFAQEGTPRSFTMQGSWSLDAGDDYCRLAAVFADGSDEIAFALERNRAENFARLILVGDVIVPFRGSESMGYRYQPENVQRAAPFLRSETADGRAFFNLGLIAFDEVPSGPPDFTAVYDREDELAFATGINAITLDEGLRDPIRIETGFMRGPIQALQACTDDLLRIWGLDYEAHQTMTRRAAPTGPAYEWLANGTIGFQDFALLGGGANPVRVMVSAAGEPTACHVHWPSLDEDTNESICEQIMENAEFTPALDAEGNAMASYWTVDPIFGLVRPFGRR